ncbi:GMC oxidoreductase [Streptomyces sp. TLI_105]|uniref:GMC oxidoreductase n=1 Tax=Streptomyces sp. TLI_105 TaxID=1881019 RepID=UPI0008995B94|nr:GMC family oxidoreductase [Streptomyces sp. TLI_105]SEB67506.1 cholesterol oxidase [Streptomyces sp. TLI_105]
MDVFDAVVVGSGFGGSVTAFRLAEAGLRVCLLERGKPFPPGSFPRTPHDAAKNFWDPDSQLYGMYDMWSFSKLDALVSSGLGGGSLIYANVLIRKPESWFAHESFDGGYEDWPVTRADLDPHYDRVERMLGAQRYPFDVKPYQDTPKTIAMQQAALRLGLPWELPLLAVSFGDPPVPGAPIEGGEDNLHHSPRYTCRLVGECDLGCNFGSKNSLDFTYLSAADRLGADIRPLCEVRAFEPVRHGFRVSYIEHGGAGGGDPLAPPERHTVRTRRLVLSAGTFGTTYLLLRNRSAFPALSPALGTHFSGNGDFLGLVFKARERLQDRPGETVPRMMKPSFGPVITSAMLKDRKENDETDRGFYIEDAGYPEFLNWLVEENVLTMSHRVARFLLRRGWSQLTRTARSRVGRQLGDALGKGLFTATSAPLLGMGRDVPNGRMFLRDGHLDLDWHLAASDRYFDQMNATMEGVSQSLGGRYASNPLWWLNRLITVHPLGGAPMGRSGREGVVDSFGRVYGYPGLSIADGSVMPGPVGPNPSLTIAALADRSADRIIEDHRENSARPS